MSYTTNKSQSESWMCIKTPPVCDLMWPFYGWTVDKIKPHWKFDYFLIYHWTYSDGIEREKLCFFRGLQE